MQNRRLEIVSAFRKSPEICSSLTGTYCKTQSKLTNLIKSKFQKYQIWGAHIWKYATCLRLWSSFIFFMGLIIISVRWQAHLRDPQAQP